MELTRRGTTNHDGDIHPCPLEFLGHIHHLLQTRRNQSTQSNDVHLLLLRLTHNLLCRHHHTHVDDLVVVTSHHHTHNILADVVHITFYRSQQHLSCALTTSRLLGLDIGLQNLHGLFHGACRLHHLGQEHLTFAKQLSYGIHARHQGSLDDIHRMGIFF